MDIPMERTPTENPGRPRPKVVQFDSTPQRYMRLLGGPPDTVTMKAGLVALQPDESVGEHTTAENEEAIVVLEGVGELRFQDDTPLSIEAGSVAYCPPATCHDVFNTGDSVLRYVYVVARARDHQDGTRGSSA